MAYFILWYSLKSFANIVGLNPSFFPFPSLKYHKRKNGQTLLFLLQLRPPFLMRGSSHVVLTLTASSSHLDYIHRRSTSTSSVPLFPPSISISSPLSLSSIFLNVFVASNHLSLKFHARCQVSIKFLKHWVLVNLPISLLPWMFFFIFVFCFCLYWE